MTQADIQIIFGGKTIPTVPLSELADELFCEIEGFGDIEESRTEDFGWMRHILTAHETPSCAAVKSRKSALGRRRNWTTDSSLEQLLTIRGLRPLSAALLLATAVRPNRSPSVVSWEAERW